MDKKSTNTTGTASAEPAAAPSANVNTNTAPSSAVDATSVATAVPLAETMPATDAATGAPVDTVVIVKPPKKKKLGLIIGIVVAVLLILGGIGFGLWYGLVYQNPENVVFDAVNNLITAKNVSPHGMFIGTISASNGYKVELTVTAESASRHLPNESSVWVMLSVRDASGELALDDSIKLNIGTIQMSDGVAYLKLDHLSESLDVILPNIFPPTNCAPTATNCLPQENPIEDALYEIADLLDGEWWQISLSDILDEVDDLEDLQADAIEELYTCALDAMNADNSSELATLYARNRFVDVKELTKVDAYPEGTTPYSVSLNYDALANFLNAAKHTSATTAFYDCYNAAIDKAAKRADSYYYDDEDFEEMKISVDDMKDVSASDLKKYLPEDTEILIFVEPWGHALRQIDVQLDASEEHPAALSVGFGYSAKTVDAPSEYRPITELFDEIGSIIYDLYYDDFDPDFACDEDDPGLCYNGDFAFPIEIGV